MTPFRPLTKDEFERLSQEQKMEYLLRVMADIRAKLEAMRRQSAKRPND